MEWLGTAVGTALEKNFFVGLLSSGIPFACYAFALLSISTGLSSILNATVPLFGAVVAWVWLKDRPHGLRIVGLALGFIGVALLAWDKASFKPDATGQSSAWAVLACLVACLCYGLSASFTKRYLSGTPALVTATGSQLGASLGLALPTLWLWPARMPSSTAWLALLAVGVLCTGLAYILYFRLLAQMGPAGSLTVTFVIPVFAVVYGGHFSGRNRLAVDASVRCHHRVRHSTVGWHAQKHNSRTVVPKNDYPIARQDCCITLMTGLNAKGNHFQPKSVDMWSQSFHPRPFSVRSRMPFTTKKSSISAVTS
jgi:drug/metabolite transporter (DMT)-like permease